MLFGHLKLQSRLLALGKWFVNKRCACLVRVTRSGCSAGIGRSKTTKSN